VAQKPSRQAKHKLPDSRRTNRRGEARRSAILEAARQVFLDKGYAGASVEDVVAKTGGSKASLYHYFRSKEGLFGAIFEAACERFVTELSVPDSPGSDVATELSEFSHRLLRLLLDPQRINVVRILIAEATRFPGLAERLYSAGAQTILHQLASYLQKADAKGQIQCKEPELAAVQFIEMIKGNAQYRSLLGLSPFPPNHSVERTVESAVGSFMKAHRPPSRTRAR
jgi:AcrR family transcriptional regulator